MSNENSTLENGGPGSSGPKKNEIEVSISTTAGFYPAEGFETVPNHQPVKHELDKAQKALHIKDVTNWIATVVEPGGKRTIDPSKSYLDNGLSGKAEIDWGPSEGGGGNAPSRV